MSNLIVREWNGRTIRQREDGYMSATDMAQANGKKVNHWLSLKSTNEFLESFSSVTAIPVTELVQVFQGGLPEEQGTWIHPDIAPDFGTWCSVPFRVQVNRWIKELMTTGSVSLEPVKPKTHIQMIAELANQMVEDERRLAEVEAENARLKVQVQCHEVALTEITAVQEEARKQLAAYPEPSEPVPAESKDAKIRRLIADYSHAKGINHDECFRSLYRQDYYRNHRNIRQRVKKGESKLQAAVRLEWIDSLYALALEMFGNVPPISGSR